MWKCLVFVKRIFLEVLDDHVDEDPKDNYKIVLWGFGFNLFEKYGGEGG